MKVKANYYLPIFVYDGQEFIPAEVVGRQVAELESRIALLEKHLKTMAHDVIDCRCNFGKRNLAAYTLACKVVTKND